MKLKTTAWAIVALLFTSSSLIAQTTSLGVFGGISIPKLESADDNIFSKGYASRSAATFGAFADLGVSQAFSIKIIAAYSGQGGIRNGLQPIPEDAIPAGVPLPPIQLYASFDNESVLNYLEVPVMAKFEWGSNFRYFLNAGPYVGFLLNATQKTSGSSGLYMDENGQQAIPGIPSISFTRETDIKDDINSVNFGFTGGGGLKYVVANKHEFILDARAALGLSYLQKDTEKNGKSRTGGVFITLGYGFRL